MIILKMKIFLYLCAPIYQYHHLYLSIKLKSHFPSCFAFDSLDCFVSKSVRVNYFSAGQLIDTNSDKMIYTCKKESLQENSTSKGRGKVRFSECYNLARQNSGWDRYELVWNEPQKLRRASSVYRWNIHTYMLLPTYCNKSHHIGVR